MFIFRQIEPCRFGRSSPRRFERVPDGGRVGRAGPVPRVKPGTCLKQVGLSLRSHEDIQTKIQVTVTDTLWLSQLVFCFIILYVSFFVAQNVIIRPTCYI